MYVLDTNVLSLFDERQLRRAMPFVEWTKRNERALYLSVITLAEIDIGILKLRRLGRARRADELRSTIAAIEVAFGDNVLPVDARVAHEIARIKEETRHVEMGMADLIIAATASVRQFVVLTQNLKHFLPTGVPACDPLVDLPPNFLE
jgi:toxin FitB